MSNSQPIAKTEAIAPKTMTSTKHIAQLVSRYFSGRNGTGVNVAASYAVLRPIAMSLIMTTLTMVASPLVHATQMQQPAITGTENADASYAGRLQGLREGALRSPRGSVNGWALASSFERPLGVIGRAEQQIKGALRAGGLLDGYGSAAVKALETDFDDMQRTSDALKARWRAAGVAVTVIERQAAIDREVAREHRALVTAMKRAIASMETEKDTAQAHESLYGELTKRVAAPSYNKLNPKNLPRQVQLADLDKLRAPFSDSAAFKRFLGENASAVRGSVPAQKTTPVSAAPTSADIQPTPDAPHTPPIVALANTTLGGDPLKIYQWVHDNIVYVPTYGSLQGAQDTLDKKSGNAFDQASLTIAMLRSAGVPARYVIGTVDVPTTKLLNWMGDFKTIDAARQVLAQGGIPSSGVISGGRVSAIRMEHVWVEAYVAYAPGRGASTTAAGASVLSAAKKWIPVDPGYKQYVYASGMNLQRDLSINPQEFVDAALQGATINESEGSVQNLNQAALKRRIEQSQQAIKQAIDDLKPNATMSDVLGSQEIVPDRLSYFAGSLANEVVAIGERYSTLPFNLRAQFRYDVQLDHFGLGAGGNTTNLLQVATSEISGKKVTISWVPATDDDRLAVRALLPQANADGSPVRPEQLPRGLPGSIYLMAELRIDGELKASSDGYRAGTEITGLGAFSRIPGLAGGQNDDWDETTDLLIAGQQTAIGLSIQGISRRQLEQVKLRLEQTKSRIEQLQQDPQGSSTISGLTGDSITGDVLVANIWAWFADLQNHGRIASGRATIRTTNGPSGMYDRPSIQYGLVHVDAQPTKLFNAITTGVTFQGVMMDIGHVRHVRWVKDSAPDVNAPPAASTDSTSQVRKRWIAYNRMRGQYSSALEHAIPERFFNDVTMCNAPGADATSNPPFDAGKPACGEAVSAVKALAIAQGQGQKIFTITQQNAPRVIPQLSHRSSVIDEVNTAVAAGKEVTIHQQSLSHGAWSGAGYMVIDPDTGAGSYLLEGGANGGKFVATLIAVIFAIWAVLFEIVFMPATALSLAVGLVIAKLNGIIQDAFGLTDMEKLFIGFVEIVIAVIGAFVCILLCSGAVAVAVLVAAFGAIGAFFLSGLCTFYGSLPGCSIIK